jgi:dTDP-4-amino-4,6-dideoxygalactose transaminase
MTTLTWDRHRGHASTYDVVALGYNYRIDEIRSALGLVQLGKLARNNARRSALAESISGTWQPRPSVSQLPFALAREISAPSADSSAGGVDRGAFMNSIAGGDSGGIVPADPQFLPAEVSRCGCSDPKLAAREVTLPLSDNA